MKAKRGIEDLDGISYLSKAVLCQTTLEMKFKYLKKRIVKGITFSCTFCAEV